MPVELKIDATQGCGFFLWRGDVRTFDAEAGLVGFQQHPDFHHDLDRFLDMRDASLSITEARSYAAVERSYLARFPAQSTARLAVLVATEVDFGAVRIFLSESGHGNAYVFRELDKALDWLDLSAAYGDPFASLGGEVGA